MSLTKFKFLDENTYFYYDNLNHALLDEEKNELTSRFDFQSKTLPKSSLSKSRELKALKILLGHACNYSCGYCVQKDIGNSSEKIKNKKIPGLIASIKAILKTTDLERIELWGGETLLYWDDLKAIMNEFDRKGITWYIPTNGTMLHMKHVEYFKTLKGKMTIGISHDGPAQLFLRGPEFLHKKIEVLKALQDANIPFSFNSVISLHNYDLFKINDFFDSFAKENGLNPVSLVFEMGRVYDKTLTKNSYQHVIHGSHLEKYQGILKRFLALQRQQYISGPAVGEKTLLKTNLFHFGNGAAPYAMTLKSQIPVSFKSNCGVDLEDLITIDIEGNLRTCQNAGSEHIQGKLEDIDSIVYKKLNLDRDGFCQNCSVLRLCKSSCPIDLSFEVFHLNHLIEKIHYSEIQLCALSLLMQKEVIFAEPTVFSISKKEIKHFTSETIQI